VALPRRGQRKFQPFCPRANVHFFVLSRWHFADGIKLSNCAVTRLFRGYDRKDSGLIGLAGRDRQAENKTGCEEFHQTGVNMLFNYCNTAKILPFYNDDVSISDLRSSSGISDRKL